MQENLRKHILSEPRLYGVSFVLDYWQLQFDWGVLTVNTDPKITQSNTIFTSKEPGFRDALCSFIGNKVAHWEDSDTQLQIRFENGDRIDISLLSEDAVGPEAAVVDFDTQNGHELPTVVYSCK
jgi:hypothetical protein